MRVAILGLWAALLSPAAHAAIVINEFRPNPVGGDPATQTIELKATAGEATFTGFYASIEGDGAFAMNANSSGSINVNFVGGLATFSIDDLENPTFTFFISTSDHSAAGAIGDITTAVDAIGIPDNGTDNLYGATLGGQDFVFTGDEPQLVFRDGTTDAWYAINDPANGQVFDISANDVLAGGTFDSDPFSATFGASNPSFRAVPEPSGILVALPALLIGASRRRRIN